MKKRYIIGSAIVALLMLVSTQIVFLNTVKSDPTAHEGDADVGDLWINELDVSSDLVTIDYIGISHVNATDDWVFWQDGTGNINASWDVDIAAGGHPEYYVLICMAIYNVDDSCNEIGNDSFAKSYREGAAHDESGTLSVALSFTQQQQQAGSQTLVCYMSACAMINDTTEAKNFTSWGHDRCIIAVDFTDPGDMPLFPTYRREANDNFPSMWSYLDGWGESERFADEEDMLESQTYFTVGGNTIDDSTYNWKVGELDIEMHFLGSIVGDFTEMNHKPHMKFDEYGELNISVYTSISYTNDDAIIPAVVSFGVFTHEGTGSDTSRTYWTYPAYYDDDEINTDYFPVDEDDDLGDNNKINLWGDIFAIRPSGCYWKVIDGGDGANDHQIQIDGGTESGEPAGEVTGYHWEESCGYFNDTQSLSVSSSTQSGITTVTVDISNVLDSDDQFFYTFAGETGDERIQVTC